MRIGIIGNGVVGNATGKALAPHVDEVRYTDRIRSKETHILSDVLECDIIFLCLPTPQEVGSLKCDTTAVEGFFQYGMPDRFRTANYVLRSTVPVGFTRAMREKYGLTNLVHSPEFLTARTAVEDAANPTRLLIGHPLMNELHDCTCEALLGDLYVKAFGAINVKCGPREQYYPRIHHMTSDESEFVKLMQNAFSAVKVSFFNEMRCFSDAKGMNWQRCMDALLAGGWINPAHTQVPGPDGKRGFGGSCLPKDLASMVEQLGLYAIVTKSAYCRNQQIDRKE